MRIPRKLGSFEMQLMTPQSDSSWAFGALRFFVPTFFFLFLNQSKMIKFFLISHKRDPCELVYEDDQNGVGWWQRGLRWCGGWRRVWKVGSVDLWTCGSAIGWWRFGLTLAWMDFCCFNNSFLPLFFYGGSRLWCDGRGLTYQSEAWQRKAFNYSHMLLHLLGEFFIPCHEFWSHLFYPCTYLCSEVEVDRHG